MSLGSEPSSDSTEPEDSIMWLTSSLRFRDGVEYRSDEEGGMRLSEELWSTSACLTSTVPGQLEEDHVNCFFTDGYVEP